MNTMHITHIVSNTLIFLISITIFAQLPCKLLLERDIQLYGKTTIAIIEKVGTRKITTNSGKKYINTARFTYSINGTEYSKWLNTEKIMTIGQTMKIKYSPKYPWYSSHIKAYVEPWNERLYLKVFVNFIMAFFFFFTLYTFKNHVLKKSD